MHSGRFDIDVGLMPTPFGHSFQSRILPNFEKLYQANLESKATCQTSLGSIAHSTIINLRNNLDEMSLSASYEQFPVNDWQKLMNFRRFSDASLMSQLMSHPIQTRDLLSQEDRDESRCSQIAAECQCSGQDSSDENFIQSSQKRRPLKKIVLTSAQAFEVNRVLMQ